MSTLLASGASVRDIALWLYLSLAASSSNTICGKLRAYQFLNSGIAVYLPGLVKRKKLQKYDFGKLSRKGVSALKYRSHSTSHNVLMVVKHII